jgi:hypothetical protein
VRFEKVTGPIDEKSWGLTVSYFYPEALLKNRRQLQQPLLHHVANLIADFDPSRPAMNLIHNIIPLFVVNLSLFMVARAHLGHKHCASGSIEKTFFCVDA